MKVRKVAFAAEFLIPKMALSREAHKYSLRGLAPRYMVSVQAMEIRLKELGLVCKGLDVKESLD